MRVALLTGLTEAVNRFTVAIDADGDFTWADFDCPLSEKEKWDVCSDLLLLLLPFAQRDGRKVELVGVDSLTGTLRSALLLLAPNEPETVSATSAMSRYVFDAALGPLYRPLCKYPDFQRAAVRDLMSCLIVHLRRSGADIQMTVGSCASQQRALP